MNMTRQQWALWAVKFLKILALAGVGIIFISPSALAQITTFNASTLLQTAANIGSSNDSSNSGQIPGFGDLPSEQSMVNAFNGSAQSLALAQLDLSGDATEQHLLFLLSLSGSRSRTVVASRL